MDIASFRNDVGELTKHMTTVPHSPNSSLFTFVSESYLYFSKELSASFNNVASFNNGLLERYFRLSDTSSLFRLFSEASCLNEAKLFSINLQEKEKPLYHFIYLGIICSLVESHSYNLSGTFLQILAFRRFLYP